MSHIYDLPCSWSLFLYPPLSARATRKTRHNAEISIFDRLQACGPFVSCYGMGFVSLIGRTSALLFLFSTWLARILVVRLGIRFLVSVSPLSATSPCTRSGSSQR